MAISLGEAAAWSPNVTVLRVAPPSWGFSGWLIAPIVPHARHDAGQTSRSPNIDRRGDPGSDLRRRGRSTPGHHTRRMAKNLVAVHRARRDRLPARLDSLLQHLVGRRFMVPHGDPVHRAQSGGIEDQMEAGFPRHDHIMGVFVLYHERDDIPASRQHAAPANDLFQGRQALDTLAKALPLLGGQIGVSDQDIHGSSWIVPQPGYTAAR